MDAAIGQVATTVFLLVLAALLPLIPAVVIYKVFPDTRVAVSGPLSGLTLKAGGAFAVYVVVFVALVPFTYRTFDAVDTLTRTTWTVTGTFRIVDADGKPVPPAKIGRSDIGVLVSPENYRVVGNRITATVATTERELPTLVFSYLGAGSESVNLEKDDKYKIERDRARHRIAITPAIEIQQFSQPMSTYAAGDAASPLAELK